MVNSFCFPWSSSSLFVSLLLLFVASFRLATSLSFSLNFTGSNGVQVTQGLNFSGDAARTTDGIKLASNINGQGAVNSVGRVMYPDSFRLWDSTSGNITTFITHFSFIISNTTVIAGDGLAFFLAPPSEQSIPNNSAGGILGVFNYSANQVVAVEFDTYKNSYDPSTNHIGIDVNSIFSIATATLVNFSISNGSNTAHATVKYDGGAMNFSVLLSYSSKDPSVDGRSWNVSSVVDLRKYLPQEVAVGFSASTGNDTEAHTILSWDFNSTTPPNTNTVKRHQNKTWLLLVIGLGIILCVLGFLWFVLWQRRRKKQGGRSTAVATAARLQTVRK